MAAGFYFRLALIWGHHFYAAPLVLPPGIVQEAGTIWKRALADPRSTQQQQDVRRCRGLGKLPFGLRDSGGDHQDKFPGRSVKGRIREQKRPKQHGSDLAESCRTPLFWIARLNAQPAIRTSAEPEREAMPPFDFFAFRLIGHETVESASVAQSVCVGLIIAHSRPKPECDSPAARAS
ncbi:MAG: hypothetical protein FJ271_31995 [Planctomycetes bacterium]|nr:hypothetical protein [Planctomycetota bacterium]